MWSFIMKRLYAITIPTHVTQRGFNPLSAKLTKWQNTLKQFVGNLPTNCLSVFGHFQGLVLKGLRNAIFRKASFENKNKSNTLMERKLVMINMRLFNFFFYTDG